MVLKGRDQSRAPYRGSEERWNFQQFWLGLRLIMSCVKEDVMR